jgi:sulfonate transport system permease protein
VSLRGGRIAAIALPVALPLVLLGLLWLRGSSGESVYFPSLDKIATRFWEDWTGEEFSHHLVPSVTSLAAGFALAIVFGVALGILMGLSSRARRDLRPLTEYFRATPSVALIPIAFLLIGPGTRMEVALIAFASAWPIVVATTDGVRGTEPMLLDTARAYGLSGRQRIRLIVLPAALPAVMAGIRVSLQFAVGLMIIANFMGSDRGLGFFVFNAQTSFDISGTWAGLVVIGLVGFAATIPVWLAERRLLGWHRGWRAATKGAAE